MSLTLNGHMIVWSMVSMVGKTLNKAKQSDGFSVTCFMAYATTKQSTAKPQLFAALYVFGNGYFPSRNYHARLARLRAGSTLNKWHKLICDVCL